MERDAIMGVDARIWQALIAGSVVALGWLWNGWRERRMAQRLRAERLRDAHKALFAEIRDVCASYWGEGESDSDGAALLERMRAEPDFVPFVPREVHDRVFEAMVGQIDVLPRQTIDAVVAFYAMVRSVQALAEDMRGERYAALEPDRRIAIYGDWLRMRRRAFGYGERALRLIDAYARGGPARADALLGRLRGAPLGAWAARFSNPGGGRSGPERPGRD